MKKSTRSKSRGLSLVEVIVIIGIVMVLAGIIWLVAAPYAKLEGKELQVVNDLKEFGAAVNLYMSDHDGMYPPDEGVFRIYADLPNWKLDETYIHPPHSMMGHVMYHYTTHWEMRAIHQEIPLFNKFDEKKDAIVTAPFWELGERHVTFYYLSYPSKNIRKRSETQELNYGVKLDGSVGKHWTPALYNFEMMDYRYVTDRIHREMGR